MFPIWREITDLSRWNRVAMPMLIEHIDAIARKKQRDMLYVFRRA